METWTNILNTCFRPLFSKIIVRGILYGLGTTMGLKASTLWMTVTGAASQPSGEQVEKWAASIAAVACISLAALLDRWHAKTDLATPPPAK